MFNYNFWLLIMDRDQESWELELVRRQGVRQSERRGEERFGEINTQNLSHLSQGDINLQVSVLMES